MAMKLSDLVPEFRGKVDQLVANCAARDVRMVPTDGVRTPWQQAVYWRQSRSVVEIRAAIDMLKNDGAPFLAAILDSIGPQSGEEVTKALPGNSWHQWGEAVDCFWEVDGAAEWSTTKKIGGVNGYVVYAEEAKKLGLTAGFNWKIFKDPPHVQLRETTNPKAAGNTWAQIDATMSARFGAQPAIMVAVVIT